MRERKGKENRPQSNGGNGRVSDRLWRLYKEAAYQRYEEPPIDNPMAVAPALFKALQDYRTDFKVIDGLRTVVEHYGQYLISWFENIRKKWSESTPQTRVEAAELVWDAVAVVHRGSVPGDIEAFLSHYDLPSCMEVDDSHSMEGVPDDCCNCEYEAECTTKQPDSNNGRVFDRLWRLYKEASYQCYKEPPIDNPMAVAPALFKALEDYRTDFKVIDGLRTVVEHYEHYLISWFENIRKKWSESTPQTRVEAAELVWDAVAVVHHGLVPGDIEAFLSHYELPSCMEVDDNHFMERVPDDCCNCEYEAEDQDNQPWFKIDGQSGVPEVDRSSGCRPKSRDE